ncbi:MAG: acyl-ACP thioesterase domain-containing protein [Ktedonobacterales bacterium]
MQQSALTRSRRSIPPDAFTDWLTVRSYEAGRSGTVRVGTILRYLEHLATSASAGLGFDRRWYERKGTAWFVREMSLLLGELPAIDDTLHMGTWVSDYKRVQALREYTLLRAETGKFVARGHARWAYVNAASGQLTRIEDVLTERFGAGGGVMQTRRPVWSPHDSQPAAELRLTAHDYEADVQQHINNCVYADWLDEGLQRAITSGAIVLDDRLRLRPRYYHIEYARSILPGTAILVSTRPVQLRSRGLIVTQEIVRADDAALVVRAYSEHLAVRQVV